MCTAISLIRFRAYTCAVDEFVKVLSRTIIHTVQVLHAPELS